MNKYWVDTATGTFGTTEALYFINQIPDDFEDWPDSQRCDYARALTYTPEES